MQVQIADAGTLRKRLTITYSKAEVNARRAKVIREMAGEVKLDGFRPGKVSSAVLEKRVGAAATQRAEELLTDEGFNQAVRDHRLRPLGPLDAETPKRDDGLVLTVGFEVKPDIAIPDPRGFALADEPVVVADADIDEAIKGMARRAGAMSAVAADETIIADDSVVLTGAISVDGVEVKKLHDFHHMVGSYALLGKPPAEVIALVKDRKPGDQLDFTTTLPAVFQPAEHANREGRVVVTIQSAQRLRAAPLDDELAKKVGIESLAKLTELFRSRLSDAKATQQRQKQVADLAERLVSTTTVAIPPRILEETVKAAVESATTRAASDGKQGDDLEQTKKTAAVDAEKGLKRFLILDALAERLAVTVSREDLDDQIRMAAQQTNRDAAQIAKQLRESGQINQVVAEIREAKTLELFLDQALGRDAAAAAKG